MKALFIASLIALVVLYVVILPLAAIWSLNTLFGLDVAYSLKTWFASLILTMVVGGSNVSMNRKQ